MLVHLNLITGLMAGAEWVSDDKEGEFLVIDLFIIRILIEFIKD